MSYSVTAEPDLEKKVDADLCLIQGEILAAMGRQVVSIILTGGYGRGEGGIVWRDEKCYPVNDYDLVVIVRDMPLPVFLLYRSKLQHLSESLTRQLELGIDLALIQLNRLAIMSPNIFWFETQNEHRVMWGAEHVLKNIPRWKASELPLSEGTRLLLNRGAMLLVAKDLLGQTSIIKAHERQVIYTAAWKAVLSWGDCLLLKDGKYEHRYKKRDMLLRGIVSFGDMPIGQKLSSLYSKALHYKFYQEHLGSSFVEMSEWMDEIIQQHERVFRWFEENRLGTKIKDWKEYAQRFPKLPFPDSFPSRTKNIVRNVWLGGWPKMQESLKWVMADQQERLLSCFPILLFHPTLEGLSWCTQTLGLSVGNNGPASWESLVERFQKIWH